MIKIAVCDDEPNVVEELENRINNCLSELGILYEICLFDKSKAFWYEVEDGVHFDIIFLDIEMPGIDGMKLAEMFQEFLPDVILIFVSSHKKYVFDSFRLDAFRFIPKDQLDDRMRDEIKFRELFWLENLKKFPKSDWTIKRQKSSFREYCDLGNFFI